MDIFAEDGTRIGMVYERSDRRGSFGVAFAEPTPDFVRNALRCMGLGFRKEEGYNYNGWSWSTLPKEEFCGLLQDAWVGHDLIDHPGKPFRYMVWRNPDNGHVGVCFPSDFRAPRDVLDAIKRRGLRWDNRPREETLFDWWTVGMSIDELKGIIQQAIEAHNRKGIE